MKKNENDELLISINNMITASVKWLKYDNGRKGFRLFDHEDGMPLMVPTINPDWIRVNENEVVIKDYSENQGIYSALLNIGFIEKHHKIIDVGMNKAYLCMLNMNYESLKYHEQK